MIKREELILTDLILFPFFITFGFLRLVLDQILQKIIENMSIVKAQVGALTFE